MPSSLYAESDYRPQARLGHGRALAPLASACIDTSDGLITSLDQLARLNQVGLRIDTEPGGDAVARCAAFDEDFARFITVLEDMPTRFKNASPAPRRQCVVARRARDRGQGPRDRTPGIAFWPTSVGQYRMRGADRAPQGETTLARRVARVLR